jgi:hypothetical protein
MEIHIQDVSFEKLPKEDGKPQVYKVTIRGSFPTDTAALDPLSKIEGVISTARPAHSGEYNLRMEKQEGMGWQRRTRTAIKQAFHEAYPTYKVR